MGTSDSFGKTHTPRFGIGRRGGAQKLGTAGKAVVFSNTGTDDIAAIVTGRWLVFYGVDG